MFAGILALKNAPKKFNFLIFFLVFHLISQSFNVVQENPLMAALEYSGHSNFTFAYEKSLPLREREREGESKSFNQNQARFQGWFIVFCSLNLFFCEFFFLSILISGFLGFLMWGLSLFSLKRSFFGYLISFANLSWIPVLPMFGCQLMNVEFVYCFLLLFSILLSLFVK